MEASYGVAEQRLATVDEPLDVLLADDKRPDGASMLREDARDVGARASSGILLRARLALLAAGRVTLG
jgi:hypothetical protein